MSSVMNTHFKNRKKNKAKTKAYNTYSATSCNCSCSGAVVSHTERTYRL